MKVKELLTDESKWCQGAYAKDDMGMATLIEIDGKQNTKAKQFCLIGAVYHCYGVSSKQSFDILCKLSEEIIKVTKGDIDSTSHYNDTHTFAEVMALVNKFDI